MPLGPDCPECGTPVHSDGMIDGEHYVGCGEELPSDWLKEHGW